MPRNQSMQMFAVRFSLADGEHIACAHAVPWENEAGKTKFVKNIIRGLTPSTTTTPEGNPDFKLISIEPVSHPDDIKKMVADLYEKNPNRVGAETLGLDTPNRILHEPDITRALAAQQIPG